MELFQVDVGLQRQHTESLLTAVCGATRRLLLILYRPNTNSTQFKLTVTFIFLHRTCIFDIDITEGETLSNTEVIKGLKGQYFNFRLWKD